MSEKEIPINFIKEHAIMHKASYCRVPCNICNREYPIIVILKREIEHALSLRQKEGITCVQCVIQLLGRPILESDLRPCTKTTSILQFAAGEMRDPYKRKRVFVAI